MNLPQKPRRSRTPRMALLCGGLARGRFPLGCCSLSAQAGVWQTSAPVTRRLMSLRRGAGFSFGWIWPASTVRLRVDRNVTVDSILRRRTGTSNAPLRLELINWHNTDPSSLPYTFVGTPSGAGASRTHVGNRYGRCFRKQCGS